MTNGFHLFLLYELFAFCYFFNEMVSLVTYMTLASQCHTSAIRLIIIIDNYSTLLLGHINFYSPSNSLRKVSTVVETY